MRSKAVAMGKIADILESRGELEEALRIHLEERMPVARAIDDPDMVAYGLFSCARIRLARGDHEKGDIQTIYEELSESFAINLKLQRPDGIAHAGILLGQVLAMGGLHDEAIKVLDLSAAAFEKIERPRDAAQVRELQRQIKEMAEKK